MDHKFEESKERCRAKLVAMGEARRKIIRLESPPPTRNKRVRVSRLVDAGPQQQQLQVRQQQQPAPQLQMEQQQQTTSAHQKQTQVGQKQQAPGKPQQPQQLAPSNVPWFIYPPEKGGYPMYHAELECVEEGRYINDTVVNIVLTWARNQCEVGQRKGVARVLDSHWYERVSRGVNRIREPKDEETVVENMKRMHRWFTCGHPFGQPVTLIPICAGSHWVLMIVTKDDEATTIFGADSLQTGLTEIADAVLRVALRYVFPDQAIRSCTLKVHRQVNMKDCGVHVIHNGLRMLWMIKNQASVDVDEVEQILDQEPCPLSRDSLRTILQAIARGDQHVPTGIFPTAFTPSELGKDLELSDSEEEDNPAPETPILVVPPNRELALTQEITMLNITQEPWVILAKEQEWLNQVIRQAESDKEVTYRLRFTRQYENKIMRLTMRANSQFIKVVLKQQ